MKLRFLLGLMLLCMMCGLAPAALAQGGTAVEVQAADGLTLKGDFYLVGNDHATVLLVHQMYTSRVSWNDYIGSFTGAGLNVLAIDLRGYGQTKGRLNWGKALDDIAVWMGWLRGTAGVRDAISIMGSSIGSSVAIVGCARDAACRTAVAVSPGWNYNGIGVEDVLKNNYAGRQFLAIYAARDRYPALGVPRMVDTAPDVVVTQTYPGNKHGMEFLSNQAEAMPFIIDWLVNHSG